MGTGRADANAIEDGGDPLTVPGRMTQSGLVLQWSEHATRCAGAAASDRLGLCSAQLPSEQGVSGADDTAGERGRGGCDGRIVASRLLLGHGAKRDGVVRCGVFEQLMQASVHYAGTLREL